MPQAVVNIGSIGHIDHGKTTLTEALSGIWTDTHSEELRRGISIRLGYADATFARCPKCGIHATQRKCPKCQVKTEPLRRVSFVDAPGHEALMATMISGAAIMDGAILVIAANEPCPQPQTREHLMVLEIIGVRNVVVVQNKIELVSREKALENYEQIKEFLRTTFVPEAPVIPISAIHKTNLDVLIETLEENIPTPTCDLSKPARMYVARSFDINRPGTMPEDLLGGVIGGSLIQGKLKVGDEIETKPGIPVTRAGKTTWQPLTSEIASLHVGAESLDEVIPGGLVGVGTKLDPSLTKADRLLGSVAGDCGTLPAVLNTLDLEIHLLERAVGTAEELEVKPITKGETLMISVGTCTTVGTTESTSKARATLALRMPVCTGEGSRVAISRRIAGRWRLIGYGIVSG